MSRIATWTVMAIAVTVVAAGCKSADDEFAPAVVPKTYAFEGQIDAKFAGTWLSGDGASTLVIVKDGSLKIETTTRSIAGKAVSHITGKWLSSGNALMFRYTVGTQEPTVLKYTATLAGDTLNLQQEGGRVKTTYKRKQ